MSITGGWAVAIRASMSITAAGRAAATQKQNEFSCARGAQRTCFALEDVGKINFFICYEVGGETSKHSLQSSTYGRDRPRESGWVRAPRTRTEAP